MNAIAAALLTGAIVIAGKYSEGKAPNMDNAIGVAGIAVALSLMEQASPKLATSFAWLIVLSVTIVYFPKIVKGAGLAK